MDYCPPALQSNKVNIKNHLKTIKEHNLGPADPTKSNLAYWTKLANKWNVSVGDARGRLCANCEHFMTTTEIKKCIDSGPAKTFKASMVSPDIVDLESKPVAWCMLYDITCSPTRTCDSQELGGPIDDVKYQAIKAAKLLNDSGFDFEEFDDPFKDTTA